MNRSYYSDLIEDFLKRTPTEIVGILSSSSAFSIETTQRDAWLQQIEILQAAFNPFAARGKIYFEWSVPRLGKRIDVLTIIDNVVFVIEFKVGESLFSKSARDQVWDYALDLKNFHQTSHRLSIVPILVATEVKKSKALPKLNFNPDGVCDPITCSVESLPATLEHVLREIDGEKIEVDQWELGRYSPTPTIVEAAIALYGGHSVDDISRNDAGATNLTRTSQTLSEIIATSKRNSHKSICFVTGVPGSGKTLVGLDIATSHIDKDSELYSVFLSGNGPLVAVLREALALDEIFREAQAGRTLTKGDARSKVKLFIQNVHNFRDECLIDDERPPIEHVALFDEAQRAWNLEQTAAFMKRKKGRPDFKQSEPEFLISCMDRHPDWAVVVCLVGGGQEINTGEAGISEWIESLQRSFPDWHIYISSRLQDSEYGAGRLIDSLASRSNVNLEDHLHLGVSMRSFRSEHVSQLVKHVLEREEGLARNVLKEIAPQYPIALTRSVAAAKSWLRSKARGAERYGILVSSQAQRLKPHAIDVRVSVDPVHWFLSDKRDVRSSYYLENVVTEFHVQGLEVDWACVTWDADFRFSEDGWKHRSFVGKRWNEVKKPERQRYQKNAYRVLLTRARQGMVIVVPEGDEIDPTRKSEYYDPTFEYLKRIGFQVI